MSSLSLMRMFGLFGRTKRLVRTGVALALAALILGLTISGAVRRGMDHSLAVSAGEEIALAIALSETEYHLHLGYVGFASVYNTIQAHWNRGAGPDGWSDLGVLISNFHNRQILNEGIRAAASLGPQSGYFTDGSLITTVYDDMGEVDYYKLSFALFGRNIESLFKTFFLLLAVSAVTFILTFRNNVYALGLVLCTLFSFYIELYLPVLQPVTPSFFGMRHSSTLALVPMWHFSLLLVFPRKRSPALIAGTLVQLAIMILAWRIRGSVAWVLMFLPLLAIFLTVYRAWPARARVLQSVLALGRAWPLLLRDVLRWPVVLLLLGLLANGAYNQASRHLIYSTDDVLPQHGLWWTGVNAFYAQAPTAFSPRAKNTSGIPEGWWYVRDYLDRIHLIPWSGNYNVAEPAPGLTSPWTGGGAKYRLYNEVMKGIFLEALFRHPFTAARVYLIEQPAWMIRQLRMAFTEAKTDAWIWLVLAAGAGVFGLVLLFQYEGDLSSLRKVALLSAAGLVVACLPNLWAFASWPTMPDQILLTVCCMSLGLGLGAYVLCRTACRPRLADFFQEADAGMNNAAADARADRLR